MNKNVILREQNNIVVINVYALAIIFCCVIVLYLCGFYYYQVIKWDEYKKKSENNHTRFERIIAPRGVIFDAYGRVIVDNRPSYDIYITREEADVERITVAVSNLCNVKTEDLVNELSKYQNIPKHIPVKLLGDVDQDCLARIEAYKHKLPGLFVSVQPVRNYPWREVGAHIVGYLGEINREELNRLEDAGYVVGDWIGKTGLERVYESVLRGKNGMEAVEVDALGRRLGVLDRENPIPGRNVWLTLDWELQRYASEIMRDKEGALVVLDVKTGAIRAMVSSPSYDPNLFVRGVNSEEWNDLHRDPRHVFLNRAIQVGYPPGSTFKPFVALAALDTGAVKPDETIWCPGYHRLGNRTYRCWKRGGHGYVDLHRAIVESCDVYFYQVGSRLGVDTIARYAKLLGFGELTGVELPGERTGLIPTTSWKKRHYGVPWQKGETLSVAIGQGFVLVTPLQLARAYAAIANNGYLVRPYIVERIEGNGFRAREDTIHERVITNEKALSLVKKALEDVVKDPRGTAHGIWSEAIPIAGKTGTAQVVGLKLSGDESSMPEHFRDHAWFAGYAPPDDPQVVAVAIIEHGGHGSSAAAPVVKAVIEKYFQLQRENHNG
ncbi:penicillin-binding protein 2 [Thermodesulforhabdus norvegica]|uniref:Peptidoglycan glycosyltransferase n=1 Tax=Thermodesulforhabdus norvegica TaxID=39841 RepID=A0A1I4VD24_9BACT|nr:penicillin-binding protein 2 [Thermodesulforhabdus norvegica]SFM99086.1 peptidoglycan glycosyltransferase [Thermodesulforhabdus norvegica]